MANENSFKLAIDALQAERLEYMAIAAMLPYMKASDRRQFMGRLERMIRIAPVRSRIEIIEHDPVKAAEWFRARGGKVINGSSRDRDRPD